MRPRPVDKEMFKEKILNYLKGQSVASDMPERQDSTHGPTGDIHA
jgi:hypothetical protein